MMVKRRSTLLASVFGVLATIFLVLVVTAYFLLRDHQDTLKQNVYDQTGLAAMQVRLHYEAMMGGLVAFENKAPGVTLDDAIVHFDVFYERVSALPSRPTYEQLLDKETHALLADVKKTLDAKLSRVDRAADGDASALFGLHDELLVLRRTVERISHKPVQVASQRRTEMTAEFQDVADLLAWVITGFVITGVVFVLIIWRQLSQAAERQSILEETMSSLQVARDEAEAASTAKTAFLAHMSHELRTPMNSILGFAQLLEMQKLEAKQTQAVGQILRSGGLLMHLIDQVLELNKIISGQITVSIQPLSPADTITTCLGMMENVAAERSITLGALQGMYKVPNIESDPNRLQQILLNLMSNAIKYNHEGGEVTLSCDVLEDQSDWVRFSVLDTGEGVPGGQGDQLFEPFNRLGRETMNIEGTGIGLTITRELTHVLGGHIGYVSANGEGSTFWVDLPMKGKETPVYES